MDHLAPYLSKIDREKLPTVAGITAAVAIILYAYAKTKSDNPGKGLKPVPTAPGWYPLVGHLITMGKRPVLQLQKWHESIDAPFFSVYMGARRTVMINDPTVAHEIFVHRGAITSSRASHTFSHNIYGVGGRGVVIAKAGKKWKDSRTLALDILAPKFVDQFADVISKETEIAAETLIKATQTAGSINPLKTLQLATLNVIMLTCFAERLPSTDDSMFRTLVDLAERTLKYAGLLGDIGAFFPSLKWIDKLSGRQGKLKAFVKEFRDEPLGILIERARKTPKDCLVKTIDNMKEKLHLDELDVTMILSDMIVAGSDTTAVSLTWAFAILVRYPKIQARMQEEIDTFVAKEGRLPKFSDRELFHYTVSVQKECMRYRTTTNFGVPHVSTEAFEYRGYYIPDATTLISSMYAMHRNPAVFPNPDKFDPERFMSNTKSMMAAANGPLENRDHFNFGWGRRLCPGLHLAEVELFDMFISVFSKCNILPTLDAQGQPEYPNIDDVKAGGVVVTPVDHCVRFVPRN
ncbi:cytochrome P450 [Zychaea mexicana]|uniref:cytochrome P450 n=1 Tax=Zychaea mexicana TaxID=64656 RepID=UPI0022FED6A0|nr:cytochrome P450 [Zychaea mexicana]KAI9477137.1 cytochrome P450 [Zychaea mexicana]